MSIVFSGVVKRILLVVALLALGGFATLLVVPRGRAQVELTLEPSMSKGAAGSTVTLVEFSDYQ
jgi:hypothetical protein